MQKIPRTITMVMSTGWSRSVFPGKIWAARLLPFLKIQVELCFPLWALLGWWEKGSQQQLAEQCNYHVKRETWWGHFPPSQISQRGNTAFGWVPPGQNCASDHSGLKNNNKTRKQGWRSWDILRFLTQPQPVSNNSRQNSFLIWRKQYK